MDTAKKVLMTAGVVVGVVLAARYVVPGIGQLIGIKTMGIVPLNFWPFQVMPSGNGSSAAPSYQETAADLT